MPGIATKLKSQHGEFRRSYVKFLVHIFDLSPQRQRGRNCESVQDGIPIISAARRGMECRAKEQ